MSLLGGLLGAAAVPLTGGASLTPMLIGAGLGAAKHVMVDKPEQEKSAKLSAEIMRYSPWTGIQAPGIKYAPGLFSSALQGGAMGAMAGQALGGAAPAAAAGQSVSGAAPSLGVASDFGKQIGTMGADMAGSAARTLDYVGGPATLVPSASGFTMPQLGSSLAGGNPFRQSTWPMMNVASR